MAKYDVDCANMPCLRGKTCMVHRNTPEGFRRVLYTKATSVQDKYVFRADVQ